MQMENLTSIIYLQIDKMELFDWVISGFVGLSSIIVKTYKDEFRNKIQDQQKKIEKLEHKISYQVNKEDVKELIEDFSAKLKLIMELSLAEMKNDIHTLKNSNTGRDAVLIEVLNELKKLNNNNEK